MSCALAASGSPARSCGRRARPRLSLADREEISRGLSVGEPLRAVARRLGRAPSTISREVKANGGRSHYRAVRAHHGAYERARRPKTPKLLAGPLCAQVTVWLEQWWSPEEIARRLRIEFPDDETMHVSHETIYQSLFVQGRGELRRELSRCLRTGRAERRPRGRPERRGQIPNMVMISERPVEVADRAVPGHWEGDLIIGKNNGSAVGTLVERTTRFVLLLHLPDGREAEKVNEAMRKAIATLPGRAGPLDHLGPGKGAVCPRRVHGRNRCPGVLLRPAQPVASRVEREHERATSSVHAEGDRSLRAQRGGPRPVCREPQQPSTRNAWIHETIREAR